MPWPQEIDGAITIFWSTHPSYMDAAWVTFTDNLLVGMTWIWSDKHTAAPADLNLATVFFFFGLGTIVQGTQHYTRL